MKMLEFKWKLGIQTVLAIVFMVFFLSSPALARSLEIYEVEIHAEVLPNGDLKVVEHRTTNFTGQYIGFYQTIYFNKIDTFSEIRIREGADYYTLVDQFPTTEPGTYAIRVYGEDYLMVDWSFDAYNESRTFTLEYIARDAVVIHEDVAELYYKFIGDGWEDPTGSVRVTLTLPDGAAEGDVLAWGHGPTHGEQVIESPKQISWFVAPLPAETFIEGRVVFPHKLVPGSTRFSGREALSSILGEEKRWSSQANLDRQTSNHQGSSSTRRDDQGSTAEYNSKVVEVYSTTHHRFEAVEIITEDNNLYMPIEDILHFTGFNSNYQIGDSVIRFSRGGKEVIIDNNSNKISYGTIHDAIVDGVIWKDTLWLPLYPTIKYLNTVIEIEPEGKYLIITNAQYTLFEFMKMFNEVVESQVCDIWDYYVKEAWYSKPLLITAVMLDVLGKGKFVEFSTGTYVSNHYKDILLKMLSEENFKRGDSIFNDPAPRFAENVLTAYTGTKWFKNLEPVDQLEVVELHSVLAVTQVIGSIVDYFSYHEAVADLNTLNIELLRDLIFYMDYDDQFKLSTLYKEADYLIKVFDEEAETLKIKEGALFAVETAADAGVSVFTSKFGLGANGVSLLYDRLGIAPSNTLYNFAATEHYVVMQGQFYAIYNSIMKELIYNRELANKERIDALYAAALLYVKIKEAYDTNVLDKTYEKVSATAEKLLLVSKSELYLDNPRMNVIPQLTTEEISAMPAVNPSISTNDYYQNAEYYLDYNNGDIPIGQLPIGTRIIDTTWDWTFRPDQRYFKNKEEFTKYVTWIIVAKNHYDGIEPHVTLLSEEIIGCHPFDTSFDRGQHDVMFGHNHWGQSGTTNADFGLRPFLNSDGKQRTRFSLWGEQYGLGFYGSFSQDFKDVIVTTKLPNKDWVDGTFYITEDKCFVPTTAELGATEFKRSYEIGSVFPYFRSASDNKRIASLGVEDWYYWTRTPESHSGSHVAIIMRNGMVSWYSAFYSDVGVRPALNVKYKALVSKVSN